jgi:sialic acid synthase SpsE
LATIPALRANFDCEVGLSDHTMGIGAAVASIALGAVMIEKHVTLRREDGGVDAAFSLEPDELAQLVKETSAAWRSIGGVAYGPTAEEQQSLVFRRSLYICEDIEAGATLTAKNVRAIRPGLGLSPKYLEAILGRRVNRAVQRGTPAAWELIG